jgi:hypothetical protein
MAKVLTDISNYNQKNSASLDTLAQLRQNDKKGCAHSLIKRARSKHFTDHLVFKMGDVVSPLNKSYWNSYHCTRVLTQNGKKITGRYCGNRWCQVCNRIRTAKAIQGYAPQIADMGNPIFLTLSLPNVVGSELKGGIMAMSEQFKKVQNHFRRTDKTAIYGLKKLEVVYSWRRKDYNQHYHFIIEGGMELGNRIIDHWLKINPTASYKGQDVKEVTPGAELELFKYFTKLTTKVGKDTIIHAESLDVIFQAMRNKRVYQPIGGMRKINIEVEELQTEEVEELSEVEAPQFWQFNNDVADWISEDGEVLTGYIPSEGMQKLLDANKYNGRYETLVKLHELQNKALN